MNKKTTRIAMWNKAKNHRGGGQRHAGQRWKCSYCDAETSVRTDRCPGCGAWIVHQTSIFDAEEK